MDTIPTVKTVVRRSWRTFSTDGETHFAIVSRPTVCARRADGHRRDIATLVHGVGAAGERQWEVRALREAVHAATGAPRGALVDKATAERVARAFIAHRASLAPAGEWAVQGAIVEVAGLDYLCETPIPVRPSPPCMAPMATTTGAGRRPTPATLTAAWLMALWRPDSPPPRPKAQLPTGPRARLCSPPRARPAWRRSRVRPSPMWTRTVGASFPRRLASSRRPICGASADARW